MSATLSYSFHFPLSEQQGDGDDGFTTTTSLLFPHFFFCFLMVCSRPEAPRLADRPYVGDAGLDGLWD
ncbi:hypothetical protein CABS03_03192 [Colletotrichum abscissum]|uniref:Uncharacterized protein n=1 Tax=Colletotrichum abscissum TaxID=1671311 RepID=A0A9Q0B303_9PEZI|nr:hypothetical protein CABS02_06833 [Colletotrichum abscissum]